MALIISGNVAFVIGLFCVNPALSEKAMMLKLNVVIAVFVPIVLFMISIFVFLDANQEFVVDLFNIQLLQAGLTWLVGIVFLYFGIIRLKKIE
jgi:hypothetical protein